MLTDNWSLSDGAGLSYEGGGLTDNSYVTQPTAGNSGWFSGAMSGLSDLLKTGLNAYAGLTNLQSQQQLTKQQQELLLAQAKAKTNASNTLAKLMPLIIGAVVVIGVVFGAVLLFKRAKD